LSKTLFYLGTEVPDLPAGPTWQCKVCGARVRTGEPHSAREPHPHATLETLIVDDYEGVNGWLN